MAAFALLGQTSTQHSHMLSHARQREQSSVPLQEGMSMPFLSAAFLLRSECFVNSTGRIPSRSIISCAAFCPYDSAPYLDKLTLYHTAEEFYNGSNNGFMLLDTESLKIRLRLGGEIKECFVKELDKKLFDIIETLVEKYSYLLV